MIFINNLAAQINNEKIIGKWKFVKMERPGLTGFDLENLTTSYKSFFNRQKQEVYHNIITTNDSLFIQVQFEKLVNDVSRMFISFNLNQHYETNGYDKSGEMTEESEKGTYLYNRKKNIIYAYRNGNKKQAGIFKIIFLDKTKLVISFGQTSQPAVFTCKKIKE